MKILVVYDYYKPVNQVFPLHAKGQLISKADWRAIDSPKKRTNEFNFLLYSPEILET